MRLIGPTDPAGMESAWVAAARGHDVTLFGQSMEPGGKTRLHAELPGGENLSSVYDYQTLMAKQHGVKLELGVHASIEDIMSSGTDEVILATGSTMTWPAGIPDLYQDEGIFLDLRTLMSELVTRPSQQPGTVLIHDYDHTRMTYAAAEFLAHKFDHVVMSTTRERFATDEPIVGRQGIYRRLFNLGVELIPFHDLDPASQYEEAAVNLINVYTGETRIFEELSLLTYSTPRRPNDALLEPLRNAGLSVHQIGDARAPRSLKVATSEGSALGEEI